jgi:hypothetical protein
MTRAQATNAGEMEYRHAPAGCPAGGPCILNMVLNILFERREGS